MPSTDEIVSQPLEINEPERKSLSLPATYEWRFEVDFDSKLIFRVTEGTAEIFGTELASGREYEFSGQNAAVFTYHGCKLEWEGKANEYVASNPTMARYANIHLALDQLRRKAKSNHTQPPSVLILGPRNSGKSTLAKILTSYAVKMGNFPMLINTDTRSPVFSPPGSLVAAPVSHILDVEYGFGLPPINGPAATHHKQPLVYNYGLQSPASSSSFYDHELSLLASGVFERLAEDTHVRESGIIIDTPSEFADIDSEETAAKVMLTVNQLKVTEILVIAKERLTSKLERLLADSTADREYRTRVFNVPQSGGVTEDNDAFIRQVQRRAISQYFFGTPHLTLSPFTVSTALKDLVVYRPLEQNEINVSDSSYLMKVEPSAVLQNCLLAVVNADPNDPVEVVANAETLGYVHVVEADEARQLLKILLPVPGKVPKKVFIMGEYRYAE